MDKSLLIPILLCSALLSFVLNKILFKYSSNLGVHDQTDGTVIRWGSRSKPTIGGISFYLIFILAALFLNLLAHQGNFAFSTEFIGLFISVTLAFIIGLYDDAYNTKPLLKLGGQILCGVIFILFGVYIQLTHIPALDYALTIFWVVGIMNSINMLDNMDGVTATISTVILTTTLVMIQIFDVRTDDPYFFILVAAAGSFIGFLFLNWKPSKIYMGDTGSQFLGALLAFVGIKFFWNIRNFDGQVVTSMQVITPIMAFIVPIMDTSFVTVARIMRGQSPFVGGKDHLTHHLHQLGIPEGLVPVLLGTVGIISGFMAIFTVKYIYSWNHYYTALFSGFILVCFATFFLLYKRGERYALVRDRYKRIKAVTDQKEKEADELLKEAV